MWKNDAPKHDEASYLYFQTLPLFYLSIATLPHCNVLLREPHVILYLYLYLGFKSETLPGNGHTLTSRASPTIRHAQHSSVGMNFEATFDISSEQSQ